MLVTGARSARAARGWDTAVAWLDTAEAVARTCGALRLEQEAVQVRAELAENSRAPRSLDLLTGRERRIAELAATGCVPGRWRSNCF